MNSQIPAFTRIRLSGVYVTMTGTDNRLVVGSDAVLYVRDSGNMGGASANNLTTTGQTLWNLTIGGDTNISGNLTTTGTTLFNYIIGGDTNISGNLTQTGITLRNLIIGGDTNISGNLTTTGTTLYNNIVGLSGVSSPASANYVLKTGDQTVSGNKTFNDTAIFNNNLRFNVSNVTGNFSFNSGSYHYVWTGLYQWTGTLPSYTTYSGFEFVVKNLSLTTGLLISGLVDYTNNTTIVIPLESLNLWSNGYSWIAT